MLRLPAKYPLLAAGLDREGLTMVKLSTKRGGLFEAKVFFESLPADYFSPDFTRRNLPDKEPFISAVLKGIETLKAEKSRRISLVLPDSTSRVFILDFEDIPSKRRDLEALLKHKVKRILPFDIESAMLSYTLAEKKENKYKFLAGLMYKPVVTQFEDYLSEIGLHCGMVDTKANNLVNLYKHLNPDDVTDTMYILADAEHLTIVMEKAGEVVLHRGKPLPVSKKKELIMREVLQSIMFWYEHLGGENLPNVVLLLNSEKLNLDKLKTEKGEISFKKASFTGNGVEIDYLPGSDKKIAEHTSPPVIGAALRSYA